MPVVCHFYVFEGKILAVFRKIYLFSPSCCLVVRESYLGSIAVCTLYSCFFLQKSKIIYSFLSHIVLQVLEILIIIRCKDQPLVTSKVFDYFFSPLSTSRKIFSGLEMVKTNGVAIFISHTFYTPCIYGVMRLAIKIA